ncbi:MAG: DUF4376 domain-containing protein [Bacteroidales bacterium]|nr:DUF4376 domain-containing protein [Bacteroidales bacterium]
MTYTRINPDTGEREFSSCKTIKTSAGQWISNPTAEQIAAEGWVEVVPPAPTPEELLERAKAERIAELEAYDSSEAVNGFTLGGRTMWIVPAERTNYLNTMQGAQRLGIESVPFMGQTIAVGDAIRMLDAINIYAMQCVAVTDAHETAINALATIEEVEAYDFTIGYPDKLNFDDVD